MNYTVNPEQEARVQELYDQVRELNAFRLFNYVHSVLLGYIDGAADPNSSKHHLRRRLLGDLADQIIFRTKRQELDYNFSVQDYMTRSRGACRIGLKAVIQAVDKFRIQIPHDGTLVGRHGHRPIR